MDLRKLNIPERRRARKFLAEENRKSTPDLRSVEIPPGISDDGTSRVRTWRSNRFLVQEFGGTPTRLSVNRTDIEISTGDWVEGITWDELMEIKRQCGYADKWAVEIFPADTSIVNVANMRHLWILDSAPAYAWQATAPAERATPAVKQDQRPQKGGWAPGVYSCQCTRCRTAFLGDKRATHCADCAYSETSPEKLMHVCGRCITHACGVGYGRFVSKDNPFKTDWCAVCGHSSEGLNMPVVVGGWGNVRVITSPASPTASGEAPPEPGPAPP